MAGKEMLIVFLYDTDACNKEEDDPMSALLYFAPTWVGENQRLSLVGQLMGVTRFIEESFEKPKIITLESGKFAHRYFGQYVLAVGTDRNIADSVLIHRAELLSALLQLYHKDIQRIRDMFPEQRQNFTDKLYHILETYLPILQYNGNIFYNIALLDLPKSASNIYLDTVQILQSCQQESGVLGGQILYHNKVIASQLEPKLAKILVLSDPLRLKTVEGISVDFHVPVGVHLINVYISSKNFRQLKNAATKAQTSFKTSNSNLLPFTVKKKQKPESTGMKRDKSLIFTNIPEEEMISANDLLEQENAIKNKSRPNHLPLRVKNITSKELPESGFSSINFDEGDSYPEFIGRTSVCSTPMTENKILHGNMLSICANTCEEFENIDSVVEEKVKSDPVDKEPIASTSREPMPGTSKDSTTKLFDSEPKKHRKVMGTPRKIKLVTKVTDIIPLDIDIDVDNKIETKIPAASKPKMDQDIDIPIDTCNFINNPYKMQKRRNSWDALNKIKEKLKLGSIKKQGVLVPTDDDSDGDAEFIDDSDVKPSRSITDPTCPLFNATGNPISKSMYFEFFAYHYTYVCGMETAAQARKTSKKLIDALLDVKPNDSSSEKNVEEETVQQDSKQSSQTETQKPNKKGLSLPLKPLNPDGSTRSGGSIFDSSKQSRNLQLTPLMAKLTALAMTNENNCNFEGFDITPGSIEPPAIKRRASTAKSESEVNGDDDETFEKVGLFVCGQQDMTMIMLIEDESVRKQELIQSLFEVCVSKLTKIEGQLLKVLNMNVDGGDKGEGGYSLISIDNKKWDTVQKTGPWAPEDILSLERMHSDIHNNPSFTEMVVRKDDNVLYGHRCGDLEVFYQQSHPACPGLPPPSDVMGNVGSVSRRRLERDHSIVLL